MLDKNYFWIILLNVVWVLLSIMQFILSIMYNIWYVFIIAAPFVIFALIYKKMVLLVPAYCLSMIPSIIGLFVICSDFNNNIDGILAYWDYWLDLFALAVAAVITIVLSYKTKKASILELETNN